LTGTKRGSRKVYVKKHDNPAPNNPEKRRCLLHQKFEKRFGNQIKVFQNLEERKK
jgi:hypothetical protein